MAILLNLACTRGGHCERGRSSLPGAVSLTTVAPYTKQCGEFLSITSLGVLSRRSLLDKDQARDAGVRAQTSLGAVVCSAASAPLSDCGRPKRFAASNGHFISVRCIVCMILISESQRTLRSTRLRFLDATAISAD